MKMEGIKEKKGTTMIEGIKEMKGTTMMEGIKEMNVNGKGVVKGKGVAIGPVHLGATAARAGECVNMRPDVESGDGGMVPTPVGSVIDTTAWRVAGVFADTDDTVVELLWHGCLLGASRHRRDERVGEPYIVTDALEGEVTTACRRDEAGEYMVYTTERSYRVVTDESGMLRVEATVTSGDYPEVVTVVDSETLLSVGVTGFKLQGEYDSRSTILVANDSANLSTAIADAYERGSADAVAAGSFVAPVFTRYRLLDRKGEVLFESMPKLHVPVGRHDMSLTTTLALDGALSYVLPGKLNMAMYKVAVCLPAGKDCAANRRVSRLEVQMTPQIHAVDRTLTARHRLESPGAGELNINVTAPGCGDGGRYTSRTRREVLNALEGIETLFETVATFDNPFGAGKVSREVRIEPIARSVKEEKSLLAKARGGHIETWKSRCCIPHEVTAAASHREGDVTVLGNLTATLWEGHTGAYYVNYGMAIDMVETCVAVTMADGRRVVSHDTKKQWSDGRLSPLYVYPDREAVSVTIQMADSRGNNRIITLPLTPCGRYAVYLSEALKQIEPEVDENYPEMYVPGMSMRSVRYPSKIIAYKGEKPGEDAGGIDTGAGEIRVIHPVGRPSSSAWEASRARFYVMGSEGIFSVAMSGCKPGAAVRIDRRAVRGARGAVTIHERGRVPRVCVLAGGDLVNIEGGNVKTMVHDIEGSMLMWNGKHAELLVMGTGRDGLSTNRALVHHTAADGWSTRILPGIPADCYSDATVSRMCSDSEEEFYDMDREVETACRCKIKRDLGCLHGIAELTVDMTGSHFEGKIEVSGDRGRGPARIFSRLSVNGDVNRRIKHRVLMPWRERAYVTIEGMMGADARVGEVMIQ